MTPRSDGGPVPAAKPLVFIGSSRDALREFPRLARQEAGDQPYQVQCGLDPKDWKPMAGVGPGAREVRVRDETGAFRVIYVANLPEAVYVLHAFQKKTRATADRDVRLAASRLREVLDRRGRGP